MGSLLERVAGSNPALGARFTCVFCWFESLTMARHLLSFSCDRQVDAWLVRLWSENRMVSIVHSPPQEVIVTGLTGFGNQRDLASMIAFVMNVSGQPMALYWAEGVVFLADFVEPEALPEEYVKGRIYASNVSHAPMVKYNQSIRVGNVDVPVIDVTSNEALRELARWIRENHHSPVSSSGNP
jgi:hypothetical protein